MCCAARPATRPNGAGKTTTIEIPKGYSAPGRSGLGLRWGRDERQLRERLASTQETQFSDKLTVYEITRLFRCSTPAAAASRRCWRTSVWSQARRALRDALRRPEQRWQPARWSARRTCFLDGPTTGLDHSRGASCGRPTAAPAAAPSC
jgi:ABC-type hemin transport system ATPase subunit